MPGVGTLPVGGIWRKGMNMKRLLVLSLLAVAATGVWLLTGTSERAVANSCAAACHAAHSQCRVAQKGSPACDAQLTQCLKGCAGKK